MFCCNSVCGFLLCSLCFGGSGKRIISFKLRNKQPRSNSHHQISALSYNVVLSYNSHSFVLSPHYGRKSNECAVCYVYINREYCTVTKKYWGESTFPVCFRAQQLKRHISCQLWQNRHPQPVVKDPRSWNQPVLQGSERAMLIIFLVSGILTGSNLAKTVEGFWYWY